MTRPQLPRHRMRGPRHERGAALVEMAIVTPLLVLLLLGIIEFGWLFGQYNDVRHGTREGARFAAVNAGSTTEIRDAVCAAMDGLSGGMTSITIVLNPDLNGGGDVSVGEPASIAVTAGVASLSGAPLISGFLPSTLTSTVEFRLEQDATWTAGTETCP